MVVVESVVEMGSDLLDFLGVIVSTSPLAPIVLEGEIRNGVTGCSTYPEVNPIGCQCIENSERFSYLVRAIMIEKYCSGSNADI